MITALIFAFGILMGALGAILMKMGATQVGHVHVNSVSLLINFLFKILTNFRALSGIALYFISAMAWTYLLTKYAISYVQPILALTYVVTPILAIIILRENVPALRWVGILIIIFGVYIVARTAT